MRTFSCLITDDRYAIPTLAFFLAADERRARELALSRLMDSQHHREVEVLENGRAIYNWARD